eukprot:RCo031027
MDSRGSEVPGVCPLKAAERYALMNMRQAALGFRGPTSSASSSSRSPAVGLSSEGPPVVQQRSRSVGRSAHADVPRPVAVKVPRSLRGLRRKQGSPQGGGSVAGVPIVDLNELARTMPMPQLHPPSGRSSVSSAPPALLLPVKKESLQVFVEKETPRQSARRRSHSCSSSLAIVPAQPATSSSPGLRRSTGFLMSDLECGSPTTAERASAFTTVRLLPPPAPSDSDSMQPFIARSLYYSSDGSFLWRICLVLGVSPPGDYYLIQWQDQPDKRKRVHRFNLLFEGDDRAAVEAELRLAREEKEALRKYKSELSGIPDSAVSPLGLDLIDRVLSRVSPEFRLTDLSLLEGCVQEMHQGWYLGGKRAIMEVRRERPSYGQPQIAERIYELASEYCYSVQMAGQYLQGICLLAQPRFQAALLQISQSWSSLASLRLWDAPPRMPCELAAFEAEQRGHR